MKDKHPLARRTVTISAGRFQGEEYEVEDWWENVGGQSWMYCNGNQDCLEFAVRSACEDTPMDNDVVFGKIGGLGKLIHVSQLGPQLIAATEAA